MYEKRIPCISTMRQQCENYFQVKLVIAANRLLVSVQNSLFISKGF